MDHATEIIDSSVKSEFHSSNQGNRFQFNLPVERYKEEDEYHLVAKQLVVCCSG